MRIYYLNLARRTDRREAMEARFAALGLVAERIEATEPADLTDEQRRRYCDPLAFRYLTEGELCCSLSHIAAMRRIVESGEAFGLILEDDAVLSSGLPGFLAAFDSAESLSPPPRNLDLLRIETDRYALRLEREPDDAVAGIGIFKCYSWSAGAAAYVISRRAAEYIAAGEDLLYRQTDRAMFNPYEPLARRFVTRQAYPALAIQENRLEGNAHRALGSDLEAVRDQRVVVDRRNRLRRMPYDMLEFIDRDIRIAALKAWHQYARGAAKRVIPFAGD